MRLVYALVLGVCMASLSPSEREEERIKGKEVPGWQTRARRSALSDEFLAGRILGADSLAKFIAAASDMYITLDEARSFVVLDRLRGPQLDIWAEMVKALVEQAANTLVTSPTYEHPYFEKQMERIVNSFFDVQSGEPRLLLQLGEIEDGELPMETALGTHPQLIDFVIDSVDVWLRTALEDCREAYEAVRYSPRLSLRAAEGDLQSLIRLMKKNNGWSKKFPREIFEAQVIERLAEIDIESFQHFVPAGSWDDFKILVTAPTRTLEYMRIPESISDDKYRSISADVFGGVLIADEKYLPSQMQVSTLLMAENEIVCAQAFALLYLYLQGVSARWLAHVSGTHVSQASLE